MLGSKRLAFATVVCVSAVVIPAPAVAEIQICNKFAREIFVAIAYDQPGYNSFVSRGWLRLRPGDCDEFDSALHLPYFYYYAETDSYSISRTSVKQNTWGGNDSPKRLWVAQYSFNIFNNPNGTQPDGQGVRKVAFSRSVQNTSGELDETMTIEADGTTITQDFRPGRK